MPEPASHSSSSSSSSAAAAASAADASPLAAGGRRVIIVEDEPRLREMLGRAIRDMDFETEQAATAELALAAIADHPVDIALCDLSLPGMDGLELCRRIRDGWPETQLIILTGHGDLEAARTAIHLDVVEFLTKPCPLAEIEIALDRALRRRQHGILARAIETTAGEQAFDARSDELPAAGAVDTPSRLEDIERAHILAALARHDGNRARTAEQLGISVRTLYYRLKTYENQGHLRPHDEA
jgi:DNA-binding NtrC family response regulator